ncbi:glycosyltransferase family 4 protein [Desertimonas flava]|uniref:glycosyltransferase family 4 protein n=1 Tax=Desertimonas flava TaxID=2064846 RepID=UPI000E34562D|nr:glycosyltransferase family 4 protein [Desertimonas flava]
MQHRHLESPLRRRYDQAGQHEARALAHHLRVGLIAPPWVPVPPSVYGGTEAVIDQLARGLQRAGCEVSLFGTGDSTCPVPTRSLYPAALGTTAPESAEIAHVEAAYRALGDVDIVHDHTLSGPVWASDHGIEIPIVTTAHGEFTPEIRRQYAAVAAAGVHVVAISHAQRRTAPDVDISAVIHHGIDPASFPFGRGDGGYVMFLGRMHPDKGAHRAIVAARRAGKRLVIAAKMWEPNEHRFFAERVAPLLGDDAVYVGEVGGQRKLDLLAGAEALVNPIRWPEPFGLVMIEALACGTPVLTFASGAAPEIVSHGHTGYLCADVAEMTVALNRIDGISRFACRARVEKHFSTDRMVDDHLRLYHEVIAIRRRGGKPTPAFVAG